ncbi:pyrroloquinoline quinone biosynthesis peptide chaperone PqqD [Nitrococcus mobilis]|uniref:PqqA binding protein n=1 Tax=Nitrococcus mobilis Nb-231 TaxID=314278 RepID=A4BR28_9GAMM|nr:pyrroloquinoline quinone biosynthesis peptide chaperone PqqD [Nitrococcus mobilis]EAR22028.1 pyrroloquinoline quinone biosynthesis protein PqqD [Nitrococcus mobilis Nb-231]
MAALTTQTIVRLTPTYRLQWEPVQNAYVLLYPEGMVTLNATAGEILTRCDGMHRVAEIIADLQRLYPETDAATHLSADVLEFMEIARNEGWLRTV